MTISEQELKTMIKKSVCVQIHKAMVRELKDSEYKMCLAKKVENEDYNVIWYATAEFMENNIFSWFSIYQLFATKSVQESVQVKVACNPVKLNWGEKVILDKYGILSEPATGGDSTALNLDNQMGMIHPGINQINSGINGEMISTPIYVSKNAVRMGVCSLKPKEQVSIWFQKNAEDGMMFHSERDGTMEVDLTKKDSETILYDENGEWKIL